MLQETATFFDPAFRVIFLGFAGLGVSAKASVCDAAISEGTADMNHSIGWDNGEVMLGSRPPPNTLEKHGKRAPFEILGVADDLARVFFAPDLTEEEKCR